MTTERRRDARYVARWATRLVVHSNYLVSTTDDVSFHGIFLRSSVAPNLGELSRLTVVPFEGDPLSLHVVPVRLLPLGDGYGVGFRLLVVPERWEGVLVRLRDASLSQIRLRLSIPSEAERALAAARR
jgi:hypothetical protein